MPTLREALASTQARLELLLQASELFGGSLDFAATLVNLGTLVVPRLADGYVVDLVDERGAIQRVAAVDEDPAKAELMTSLMHLAPPDPKSPNGIYAILAAGQSVVTERMTDEGLQSGARDPDHLALLRQVDMRSGMIVPLRARGRAVGLLWLYYSRSKRAYAKGDLALIEEIAARAALAIDNARLWRESQDAIHIRDEFLSIASHELRTPLTSLLLRVQGELRHLHRDPNYLPTREALEGWLASTNAQIGKLTHLVEELLDVSHLTSGEFRLAREEVDLGHIIRRAAASLADEAQRKGSALTIHAETAILGWWDPFRVEQVTLALLSNAIKYGEGQPLDVRVVREGETARITVQDHGIGIAAANLERIFERFERQVSSRHYGGFGLGLWIAREIVESSGGRIRVESQIGKGSTFSVELPLGRPSKPPEISPK